MESKDSRGGGGGEGSPRGGGGEALATWLTVHSRSLGLTGRMA